MKKAKIAVGVVVAALVVCAAVFAVWFAVARPLDKKITAKGYEISVPGGWVSDANGTLTDKKGNVVGKFLLINEQPDQNNMASYSGFVVQGSVESEALSEVIMKNTFLTDGGKAVQYFISDMPNPEPYAISITLLRTGAGNMLSDRIAASLKIPEIGAKPPQKNVAAPLYSEIGTDKIVTLTFEDGSMGAKNVSLIDVFMSRMAKKESTGLDILTYVQSENGDEVKTWSHIESDGGRGFLYTYYDRGDGIYTYDNNPVIFESITKEILEDTGTTSYRLKIGETELSQLLEVPTNIYRDNAQALVALKTQESTDESIMKILEQILTKEQMENVTAAKNADGITITFGESAQIDRAKLSKDAAVIFRLLPDAKTITVKQTGGDTFIFDRNELLETVPEADGTVAADTPEDFAKFAEELEAVPPATPEGEKESSSEGSFDTSANGVIYSKTVTFTENTLVPHPTTGKMVAIGPYAERMGVSQYLGKPITCTIKKTGSIYMATATCGGSVIYSQPLETEADVQNAINQFNAYS